MDQWYLKKDEQGPVYGPLTSQQLQEHWRSGKIQPTMLISPDRQRWGKAEQLFAAKNMQANLSKNETGSATRVAPEPVQTKPAPVQAKPEPAQFPPEPAPAKPAPVRIDASFSYLAEANPPAEPTKKARESSVTRVQSPAPALAGDLHQFSHYEVIKELGRGGMGVVYKAMDTQLKRVVALKLLLDTMSDDNNRKRFLREAEMSAKMDHPNIVHLYEVGETPKFFIAMEFIEGRPFTDFLENKRCPLRTKLDIFRQVCEAMDYAHKQKVVHRDLKPQNIMVTEDQVAKVMDFGLAKSLADRSNVNLSREGQVLGTPKYMSPEQADGKKLTRATDIYSLGVILYEILTGRAPYEGDSVINILSQLANNDPILPRELNADIPRDLQNICMKCLEKNPKNRYFSAKLLCNDIEAFLENKTVSVREPNMVERTTKWVQRNKILTAFLFMLVIAVIATTSLWNQAESLATAQQEKLAIQAQQLKLRIAKEYKEGCDAFHRFFFDKEIVARAATSTSLEIPNALEKWAIAWKSAEGQDVQTNWMIGCNYLILNRPKDALVYIQKALDQSPKPAIRQYSHQEYAQAKRDAKAKLIWAKLTLLKSLCMADQQYWQDALALASQVSPDIETAINDLIPSKANKPKLTLFQHSPWPPCMDYASETITNPWPKARYYSIMYMLPEEESLRAYMNTQLGNFISEDDAQRAVLEGFGMQTAWVLKTFTALQNGSVPWANFLLQKKGVPASDLKEMMWDQQGVWILNMVSPFWVHLEPRKQREYAGWYQEGYAEQIREKICIPLKVNGVEFPFVLVPPGMIWVRNPQTEIDKMMYYTNTHFRVLEHELTQQQWVAIAGSLPPVYNDINEKGKTMPDGTILCRHPSYPIVGVSFADIQTLCELGKKNLANLEPLWEHEWEYVARAGSTYCWSWGENQAMGHEYGWFALPQVENARIQQTKTKKKTNSWQLFDMEGNVTELCYGMLYTEKNKNVGEFAANRGGCIGDNLNAYNLITRNQFMLKVATLKTGIRLKKY